ncbi:hypothetical protein HYALB_00011388 [Hymenoscyphus albidus]|uniref:Uncharacterized protein n=1 Tax=Hymenoscyphus albidus TaxID=595503 RepID=A0A9N9LCE2_9HELO|nr:hypothetical protein HYALB_00011388 [Hymenoscyphus albidus]
MSSIKDAFESILDDFKKDLTKKELDKFQFATLKWTFLSQFASILFLMTESSKADFEGAKKGPREH